MDWLIDLGNTRLKWAALGDDGVAGAVTALAHGDDDFVARWQATLAQACAGDRVWLAAVAAPPLRDAVDASLQARALRVETVQVRSDCGSLRLGYADPAQLGVDRFLALLGALNGGAQLIVSIGSAVTVDLLDADNRHHGGLIAPTAAHQRQALAARFAVLDRPDGQAQAFAADTADAVASGCRASTLGLILWCWQSACRLLDAEPAVVLCGGGAAALADALPMPWRLRPQLVLDGLARYAMQARGTDA